MGYNVYNSDEKYAGPSEAGRRKTIRLTPLLRIASLAIANSL